MSKTQLFFGFQGRVRRSTWWLTRIAIMAALYLPLVIVSPLLRPTAASGDSAISPVMGVFVLVWIIAFIPAIWIDLAVTAKRWHDRGKSGWWTLISFIPLIGGIWMFIECGCLDGIHGSNRFGDSPKGFPSNEAVLAFD